VRCSSNVVVLFPTLKYFRLNVSLQLSLLIPQGGLWILSFLSNKMIPSPVVTYPCHCLGDSFSLIKNVIIHPFTPSCIKVLLFSPLKWQVTGGNCRSRQGAGEPAD
ncbi:hypothetical protein ATANTOWER_022662, partial [Ataeniobius toweri]|nr:hypothetical protein [Ataeniobius toweri]